MILGAGQAGATLVRFDACVDGGVSAVAAVGGDPGLVTSLGLRVSRAERQINCPALKRASIIDASSRLRASATQGLTAARAEADTIVGRAVNLSQVFPELRSSTSSSPRHP